jgi:quinol monooxygenase YgiN
MTTILIAGQIEFSPENRDAALANAKSWIDMALAEKGCRHYAWSADPHYSGRVHVFEEWESSEDLQVHLEGEAYFGMLGHLGSYTILSAETLKYRCDLSEPVYGPDGVATATFLTAKD